MILDFSLRFQVFQVFHRRGTELVWFDRLTMSGIHDSRAS
jgi:hypothetical protein